MKSLYTVACFLCLSTSSLLAQDIVSIADGGTINDISCASSVIITDSNADNGDYEPNESHVITLCVETGSTSTVEVIISPELYGDIWDVDENSSLFVYDGDDNTAPLLGEFNSIADPFGITVTGTGTCLTLEFISGAESSGEGFTATFTCVQPLQPFLFTVNSQPELEPFQDFELEAIKICFLDSVFINVATSYPLSDASGNGYEQSDETSFFRYLMGDGTIYQGFGLTEISHQYSDAFGYLVTVLIQDVQGRVENEQFYVLTSPRPNFSNFAVEDTLCIGEETVITGGIFENDTVGISPSSSAILGGGILGEQLYLPDGNDENYETSILIDEFNEGQLITSVTDFVNFCINIEHSYLGDLEMMLTCPDGTSINVFNSFTGDGLFPDGFGGGGTFLGDANDMGGNGIPGIGFDYCFAPDAEWGTMGDELAAGNTVPVSQGTAMSPGTYSPEDPFSDLIGCPLNGEWTLTVRDNLFIDDGFIFNWSIYFDPTINPSTVYYSPDIVEVYWEENDDIIEDQGTSIVVSPSQEGNNSFTFVAIDEFGCLHDTAVNVYIRPFVNINDAIACDLTHTLGASNAPNGGVYTILDAPTANSILNIDQIGGASANLTSNEYGLYTLLLTENNCGYQDEAIIDFRPDPQVAPLPSDTILCVGASILLDAGPQLPNSGNFNIVWTRNGQGINSEDYAITADQTGQYIVNINGVCGSAADTSNIVAITLEFEGDTVCSLQAAGSVDLTPEGTGTWSSNSDNISFSSANQLNTAISSSEYGEYAVTFTDSRCLQDGVTRLFRFVEQPVAVINPENPDFCVDSDSLVLRASVNGSNAGTYFWSINGETQITQADSLVFPPLFFEPLETYEFNVLVQDAFSVCPLAEGSMNFVGEWCSYIIPNVVTPNGDGRNDRFHVQFLEFFPNASIRIYDRWGLLVFEQSNYDQYQVQTTTLTTPGGWDASDQVSGTYFYELLLPSVQQKESGYIQVLKGEGAN